MKPLSRFTWKYIAIGLFCVVIGYLLVIFFVSAKWQTEKTKTNACIELMIITVEQLGYSIEKLNMTIEEFGNEFIRYKVDKLLEEE